MIETIKTQFKFENQKKLIGTIKSLRSEVLNNSDLLFAWQDALYEWDRKFKNLTIEKYDNTCFLQKVPAWQVLIGGTVEPEQDINDDQHEFVNEEVNKFVTKFKDEHKL